MLKNNTIILKEWKKIKLGDFIDFRNGYAFNSKKYTSGGKIIIRMSNISVNGELNINNSNIKYTDENTFRELSDYQLKKNDLVMCMTDVSKEFGVVGKTAIIDKDDTYVLNQRVGRIRPNKELDVNFLYYYTNSKYFLNDIYQKVTGSAQYNLSTADIKQSKILLPPLPEQQKIAEILSCIDKDIEKTDQIIKETEKLKKGLVQELLTKGKVFKLDDISNIKRGASPRPIGDQKYFSDQGRGWIRISDVTKTYKYLNRTSQYLSKLGESLSVKVDKGDLIMSICATVGKPIIVNIPACIHDGFVFFKDLDSKKVDKECLFYALLKNEQNIQSKGQTGSQKNLNTTIVGNTQIQLPGVEEQKQTAEILSEVDNKIDINKQIKNKLTELKRGLMQDLLSGRVRVKNPAIKWQG